MSIQDYVRHGQHQGFLGIKEAPHYTPHGIKLFDIGEEDAVGAEYGPGDRQVQPLAWQTPEIQQALKQTEARPDPSVRPKVVLKHPGAKRPKLNKR